MQIVTWKWDWNKRIAFINLTKEQYDLIFEHFNQLYPNTYKSMYEKGYRGYRFYLFGETDWSGRLPNSYMEMSGSMKASEEITFKQFCLSEQTCNNYEIY